MESGQELIKICLMHIESAPLCDDPEEHLQASLMLSAKLSQELDGGTMDAFLGRVLNTTRPVELGQRVKAVRVITECGAGDGNPQAEFPHNDYIHALIDETGVVENIEDDGEVLDVRFDKTGTATIVGHTEVVLVEG
jgi:hypothetical protein